MRHERTIINADSAKSTPRSHVETYMSAISTVEKRTGDSQKTISPTMLARGLRTDRNPCVGISSRSCGTGPLDFNHVGGVDGWIRARLSMPSHAASVRKCSQVLPDVFEMAVDNRER